MRSIPAALALAGAFCLALCPARATWKPEYANQPFEVQQWYRNAELTKEAQGRFPFKKCCDHADVVKTRFRVDRTSGGDEWYWWDAERAASPYGNGDGWRRVPDDVVHPNEHAPDGQPTLFIYNGKETCFFPADGGI